MIHSHLRMSGRWRVRDADWPIPAQRVAGHPHAGEARRPVRRPGARADDGEPDPLRPADRGPRPGHPRAGARRGRRSCAGCARTTRHARSATRCSTSGSSPGSGTCGSAEGCFAAGIDPWRRTGDVSDEEVLEILHATRPRMQQSALRRHAGQASRSSTASPASRARAAGSSRTSAHAGRATTTAIDILVSTMSATEVEIGHKGADLIVPGNTPASFDAALAHGVDMIEFDVLPEHQHEPGKGRLLLAHDYEHVERRADARGGPGPPRERAVRRRRARRRPQAPRLRAARRRRAARARPDRAHADLLELDALADRPARSSSRGCASATRCRA